jgi:hypothetical protein
VHDPAYLLKQITGDQNKSQGSQSNNMFSVPDSTTDFHQPCRFSQRQQADYFQPKLSPVMTSHMSKEGRVIFDEDPATLESQKPAKNLQQQFNTASTEASQTQSQPVINQRSPNASKVLAQKNINSASDSRLSLNSSSSLSLHSAFKPA